MKTLIFEKPSLAPLPGRIGWAFVTALFWLVWIYLWMPLITFFLWMLGWHFYERYFPHNYPSEQSHLKHLFSIYACVVIVMGGSLLIWARVEFLRFHDIHRRTRSLPVAQDELAWFAQIPINKIAELSALQQMVAHHDEKGDFLYAEVAGLGKQ